MKRLILLCTMFAVATASFAQFSDTTQLKTFIRDTIKDRRPDKVTAAQIQKAFLGASILYTPNHAKTGNDSVKTFVSSDTFELAAANDTYVGGAVGTFDFTGAATTITHQLPGSSAFAGFVLDAAGSPDVGQLFAMDATNQAFIKWHPTNFEISFSGAATAGYFFTPTRITFTNKPLNIVAASSVPANTADAMGIVGDMLFDDNYIYRKTSTGWKRAAFSTF